MRVLLAGEIMKKVVLTFIIGVLLLTGCSEKIEDLLVIEGNGNGNKTDSMKFKEEFEALNSTGIELDIDINNPIKFLNENEIINFLEEKTGVVFMGTPNCNQSRNILPILFEVVDENNIDSIYYLNPNNLKEEVYVSLLENYLENAQEITTPNVLFVRNGEVVGRGVVSSTPPEEMTHYQKDIIKENYLNFILKMQGE